MKHGYNDNHTFSLIANGVTTYKPELLKACIRSYDYKKWYDKEMRKSELAFEETLIKGELEDEN